MSGAFSPGELRQEQVASLCEGRAARDSRANKSTARGGPLSSASRAFRGESGATRRARRSTRTAAASCSILARTTGTAARERIRGTWWVRYNWQARGPRFARIQRFVAIAQRASGAAIAERGDRRVRHVGRGHGRHGGNSWASRRRRTRQVRLRGSATRRTRSTRFARGFQYADATLYQDPRTGRRLAHARQPDQRASARCSSPTTAATSCGRDAQLFQTPNREAPAVFYANARRWTSGCDGPRRRRRTRGDRAAGLLQLRGSQTRSRRSRARQRAIRSPRSPARIAVASSLHPAQPALHRRRLAPPPFVYMADRWTPSDNASSAPLFIDPAVAAACASWHDSWRLDNATSPFSQRANLILQQPTPPHRSSAPPSKLASTPSSPRARTSWPGGCGASRREGRRCRAPRPRRRAARRRR